MNPGFTITTAVSLKAKVTGAIIAINSRPPISAALVTGEKTAILEIGGKESYLIRKNIFRT